MRRTTPRKCDMAQIGVTVNIDESSLNALVEAVKQGGIEALRPAKVVVSAPYAASLEFGTMPAKNKGPTQVRCFRRSDGTVFYKEVSESFWAIYQWATRHARDMEPYDFAYMVHEKIMSKGLAPHPFVRPALYEFEENFTDIMTKAGSLKGAAEVLAEMIKDNLNGSIPKAPINDTGALMDSIEASYDDEPPAEDYPDRAIWDIPEGDIHGNTGGGA